MVHLPVVDHQRLAHPPLKAMLGQVRFPAILGILDRSFVAGFQEEVRAEYPELAEETQFGLLVGPTGPVQTQPTRQWRLSTADGRWSITLAQDALTLEAAAAEYTDYHEFRHRFGELWPSVVRSLRPQRRVQQGLRYVNHVDADRTPAEWRELINPELIGPVGGTALGDDIDQAVSDYRIRQPDGILALKHGLVRAGPERKAGYLLDFDYFTQEEGELTVESVLGTFDRFHDVIYPLFRWCVTDAAISLFSRQPEAIG
jgi:uncharacterized protein (TIGR04255 family)